MRDLSVSIAKGIAIILMVMGHAGCPDTVNSCLGMMRMPLFFFMSGYCFKEKYLSDAATYMKRRVTGIYWPYLKWSLFFLFIHNICFSVNIYSDEYGFLGKTSMLYSTADFLEHGKDIVTKMAGHEQLLGGFWFLKSLFVGSILFFATRKVVSRFWGIASLLIIAILLSYFEWKMPYFRISSREFLASCFIYAGHLYKSYQLSWHKNLWFNFFAIIAVGIGCVYFPASMLSYKWWQVVPYALCALLGTLVIFNISCRISQYATNIGTKFLIYVGGYTFNVLTWHFLSMKLVSLLLIAIYGLPIKQLSEFPVIEKYAHQGWWILYLCVGVSIPVLWTYCYHRLKDTICGSNI